MHLVARAVRQAAVTRALVGAAHLVLAAHERTVGAERAGDALAGIARGARRLAAQHLSLIVEVEATLAGHHVGDRTAHDPRLRRDVVGRIETYLEDSRQRSGLRRRR